MLNYLAIYPETIADGDGIRYAIYLAGCSHCCKGCHNPLSWNPQAGKQLTAEKIDAIIEEINSNPLLDGVTFSGGDPLFNPTAFRKLSKRIKEATQKSIWCYTGYTFEQIKKEKLLTEAIEFVDIVVDGQFKADLYSPTLRFRGSSNQNIIHLREQKNYTQQQQ
ncbi:MAG: anaerobic ribonucleoside-triphosphate reductase activating protein [Phocaeicola sp.]